MSLINKKHAKQYALDCASNRAHKFTRVSADFLIYVEAQVKEKIRQYVSTLPSKGKTIKAILFLFLAFFPQSKINEY